MSDAQKQPQNPVPPSPVNDRRRFSPEGDPLPDLDSSEVETAEHENPVNAEGAAKASAATAAVVAENAQLKTDLEASRKRVDELARAFQALDKDREDFKARLNRERERLIDVEKGNVALTLLEAIDELDRCLSASEDDTSALAEGVRLIRGNLIKKLDATGIQRMPLAGKPFDADLAEAIDMEVTADPALDGQVTGEIRAAYSFKERVIRPGRVKVAKYVKPADA